MDWADTKAREWLTQLWPSHESQDVWEVSLAAMLREVQDEAAMSGAMSDWVAKRKSAWRADVLAEVRRVVEEIEAGEYCDQGKMGRLILSRLEALK